MTITSPQNQHLKEIRRLTARRRDRERAGRFVAEGEDLLRAAAEAGWEPTVQLLAAGLAREGLRGLEVDPELLRAISGLGSGTRAIGVFEERWAEAASGPVTVALYGVGDPGNVGTVLRSAEAFGADCVLLGPECADPFSPKAVRASMGAIFTVPVVRWDGESGRLPGRSVALIADPRVPTLEQIIAEAEGGPVTLLIGAERTGLPAATAAACDAVATIPVRNHSLNAAMAATVAVYELTRRMPRA